MTLGSFTFRLTLALALTLLGYGAFVGALGRHVAREYEQESLQRVSYGLAQHIVEHWPEITRPHPQVVAPARSSSTDAHAPEDVTQRDVAERQALLSMLMVVNPGVQVYVLDADGRVNAYIGEPGMVRDDLVDLVPVRAFLAGAALPLRGTDPMGSGQPRIFSAAMFPPRPTDHRPPGYLYIVLDGQAQALIAGQISLAPAWRSAAITATAGLLVTLLLGVFAMRKLTQPLHRLAARIREYSVQTGSALPSSLAATPAYSQIDSHAVEVHTPHAPPTETQDEVKAIAQAFNAMTARLEKQALRELQQGINHREMMASVAHDLRTPLTALHGHLEALAGDALVPPADRKRMFSIALAQSDKVRRLSQQLFELATLQSAGFVLHRERFWLDELVTDAVQKFELTAPQAPVTLSGPAPGRVEFAGDMQLIERALTNLIDNAIRHAPTAQQVRVSLSCTGPEAQVLVEDNGPGLPEALQQRLASGASLRDPPLARTGGGIGGLGLAIAQRVATLHGGSLRLLPAPAGGTRLCLALPLTG